MRAGMEQKYNPKSIEEKWQHYWDKSRVFEVGEDKGKEKYYLLEMFPYPPAAFIWATSATTP